MGSAERASDALAAKEAVDTSVRSMLSDTAFFIKELPTGQSQALFLEAAMGFSRRFGEYTALAAARGRIGEDYPDVEFLHADAKASFDEAARRVEAARTLANMYAVIVGRNGEEVTREVLRSATGRYARRHPDQAEWIAEFTDSLLEE